jgi:hypothetical protein
VLARRRLREHARRGQIVFAAEQQTVEQLAVRQDQMASEITKLQAADQEILEKIPAPPPPHRVKKWSRHKQRR